LAVKGDHTLEAAPEPYGRSLLTFLADLLRDCLESYRVAALALQDLAPARSMDQKTLVRTARETGRAEYLAGRISTLEALSRPTLENAILYFIDQKILIEDAKRLKLGPGEGGVTGEALADQIGSFLAR